MNATRPRLLLIDDGETYARAILEHMPEYELAMPDEAAGVLCAPDGKAALAFLASGAKVDAVLLDMHFDVPEDRLFPLEEGAGLRRTRRFQGVAILREIRARYPHLPVVLLTALADLSLVEAAAELVAQSVTYVLDGDDLDTLRVRIHGALDPGGSPADESAVLWGDDSAMVQIRRRLQVLSRGSMPVILEGETGCGKSYLAERVVHASSGRTGPFVVLDLSTVPENLMAAHLFGAERGAYTGAVESRKGVFEMANGGTLLIDEIQNASLEVQKQLLLVLQDRRVRPLGGTKELVVDVKVVVASNAPLDSAVAAGAFRPDLYMRLSPATRVRIPPLRERMGDFPYLASRFADRAFLHPDIASLKEELARHLHLSPRATVHFTVGQGGKARPDGLELRLPGPAWDLLLRHLWPGNMRELEMVMHNLIVFTLVDTLDAVRVRGGISSPRLQVDPGLVGGLLSGSVFLGKGAANPAAAGIAVEVKPGSSLNEVSRELERQVYLSLYQSLGRDFSAMAQTLLGDARKGRAVRLRFNQLGLKVRELGNP